MLIDPFELKSVSKLSPRRIAFTARARTIEYLAGKNFEKYGLAEMVLGNLPALPGDVVWGDTSVTKLQLQHLLKGLDDTRHLKGCVVEVGSFRGVTTRCLSGHTKRKLIAVDPFGGYGATNKDYETFKNNISNLPSVEHLRKTSGVAAASWEHGPISLIFIDAVHNYVNVSFDISVWWPLLEAEGIMAFHDTDDPDFPGARKAVFELVGADATLYAHPDNITLVRKNG